MKRKATSQQEQRQRVGTDDPTYGRAILNETSQTNEFRNGRRRRGLADQPPIGRTVGGRGDQKSKG